MRIGLITAGSACELDNKAVPHEVGSICHAVNDDMLLSKSSTKAGRTKSFISCQ